ncbi:MAG: STAS domain-containing protein [Nitrospinota bacterium]|nr:STAS domain-containing protein [Nitrospinota bacterium]
MKCESKVLGDLSIFTVEGDIVFNYLSEIREIIKGQIDSSDTQKFAINLENVGIIDSAGVGFIVSVYKSVLSKKGKFGLIGPNESVENVLETVGLTRLFKVFKSEDEAVKAL